MTAPVALTAALVAAVAPALGDEAATEARLKNVGVPQALRDDVRAAIDRGVAFLAAKQRPDGVWADPADVVQANVAHGDGLNALCALALVHADTAASRAASRRAVSRLFPPQGGAPPQLVRTTYGAGLALLLLDATRSDSDWTLSIATHVANGRDTRSGTWNYRTGPGPSIGLHAPPHAPELSGPINLSTSQFAALGLHAAARRGARIAATVWTDVLNGLLVSQQNDGSWTYAPHHPEFRSTYATGTLMGVANLALAALHLRAEEDHGRGTSRARRVRSALDAGRVALDADGVLTLWTARRGEGAVDGYALWSLEKACVFLDTERLDGIPWYADAARTLCDVQRADGSWTSSVNTPTVSDTLTTTSFALLVLVRDIDSIRETTAGPDAPPPPVVTPSGPPAAPPAAAPHAPGPVPIDVAAASLARFREFLAGPATPNRDLLALLDVLARARGDLAPAADPAAPLVDPAALLRGIEAAFLDALFLAGEDPGGDEEGRRPVCRRAAELLSGAPDTVLAEIRARLERLFRARKADDGPFAVTPYRPAFGLLAARGDESTLAWMLDAALHDDLTGERAERSLALLLAVPRFRGLPGGARLEAAQSIARRYVGRESAAAALASMTPGAEPRDRMLWSRFRPRVVDALLALASDPATGAEPRDAKGRALLSVATFSAWLRDHDDRRRAPWR